MIDIESFSSQHDESRWSYCVWEDVEQIRCFCYVCLVSRLSSCRQTEIRPPPRPRQNSRELYTANYRTQKHTSVQSRETSPSSVRSYRRSPVDTQRIEGGVTVAHGARPAGLPLVHLKIEGSVEALQVSAASGPTGDGHAHLCQLRNRCRFTLITEQLLENKLLHKYRWSLTWLLQPNIYLTSYTSGGNNILLLKNVFSDGHYSNLLDKSVTLAAL